MLTLEQVAALAAIIILVQVVIGFLICAKEMTIELVTVLAIIIILAQFIIGRVVG